LESYPDGTEFTASVGRAKAGDRWGIQIQAPDGAALRSNRRFKDPDAAMSWLMWIVKEYSIESDSMLLVASETETLH
jgi:hypothetical protein